jgi:small subunit ribosomal protein S1
MSAKVRVVTSSPGRAMEELLAKTGQVIKVFKKGEEVEGVITALSSRLILVDIGAKTEGVVTDRELKDAGDVLGQFKVGDKIKAFVKYSENDQGQVVLSLKKALEDSRWVMFEEWMSSEKEIEVTGLEVNKGGMIVKIGNDRGFVPTSQFGEQYLGKMNQLLNKNFKAKVIEVDKEQNRLIFSEKLVSEAEGLAKKDEALIHVNVGDNLMGTVSGIMPFGVFVTVSVPVEEKNGEMAKVEGLVHISEISWEKVSDPNVLFKVGQEVNVQVIGVDKEVGKLNLSIKRMGNDPWSAIESKFAVGTQHKGKVVRVAPYGTLVNFERGIDGLIHVSKQPQGKEYVVGEEVDVYVEMLDVKTRRMSLGVVLTEVPVGYR